MRRFLFDDQVLSDEQAGALITASERLQRDEGCGMWAIRWRDRLPIVGFTGYWYFHDPPQLELIYGLAHVAWGRGLASEAARAMLDYGFETLGLTEVVASCDVANNASVAVMERIGMRFDRQLEIDGKDLVSYRLRSDDGRR